MNLVGSLKRVIGPLETGARRSRRREARPSLDNLEGRALLSGFRALAPRAALIQRAHLEQAPPTVEARQAPPRAHPRQPAMLFRGPVQQRIVGGHVSKLPRFYSEYQGPIRPDLNGAGAMAQLIPGVGYVFTGRVQRPIDPSRPAEFVFGVNRGGATGPSTITAPSGGKVNFSGGKSMVEFPRRPMIFVDALVTVSVGPEGNTGTVRLMGEDPDQATTIPAEDIQIRGRDILVRLDPSLLPPNGTPVNMSFFSVPANSYSYAFWTRDPSIAGPGGVASFVPEYNITPMGFFPHG